MTRKELARIASIYDRVRVGYCCYQEDGINTTQMVELGSNSGYYGWNWTAYHCKENATLYVSGYRNFPAGLSDRG